MNSLIPDGWADDPKWRDPPSGFTGWGVENIDVLHVTGGEELPFELADLLPRAPAARSVAEAVCGDGFLKLPDTGRASEWTPGDVLTERGVDVLAEAGGVNIVGSGPLRFAVLANSPLSQWATDDALVAAEKVAGTLAPSIQPASRSAISQANAMAGPTVAMRRYADVQPREVSWLWPDRIALGKLTLLAGDPGLGKSFVTLDMAARVSTGTAWPDGTPCPLGSVVLLNCEDDPEDTIRPRLDAAGADVHRIAEIEGVKVPGREGSRGVTLEDVPAIGAAIDAMKDCRLVIADPVSAYLSDTDSHKNAEIRGLLAPLAKMAQEKRVAIVMVTHLSKGGTGGPAMYRSMGSLAFVAASRAAYTIAKDKDDPNRRMMLPVKNNIGNDRTGFAYSIVGGKVAWESEEIDTTADEALSPDTTPGPDPDVRDEAKRFLQVTLSMGGLPATEVYRQAAQAGIARKTLDRAKKEIGITSRKQGFSSGGGWVWELPSVAADQLIASARLKRGQILSDN